VTLLDLSGYTTLIEQERIAPPEWNLPIEHWSPSSLTMLRRCPYQWQERYLKGKKTRPAEAPVMGTAVHAAFERNFGQKIETHEDLPMVDLLDWYMSEGFAQVVYDEQEKALEEVQWDTGPEETRQRGYQIVAAYQKIVAPRIQPLQVETKISVDMGAPVPVEGRFDVEREESMIDYKTGKRAKNKPDESWRFQGAVYMEAVGKPVEFHSLSASETKNAVTIVTPLESSELLVAPSDAERAEMRRTIRAISMEACLYMEKYGPDESWPTHGRFHSWACNYCGFRPNCPAWRDE
jgi:RecB family exonuclease